MERSPSLNPSKNAKPIDMSDQDNYSDQQIENMTKAIMNHGGSGLGGKTKYAGTGADRESSDNILDDQALSSKLKNQYNNNLQGYNQNFRGANITSRGAQGHGSPFDTALSRYSGNQAPHINF